LAGTGRPGSIWDGEVQLKGRRAIPKPIEVTGRAGRVEKGIAGTSYTLLLLERVLKGEISCGGEGQKKGTFF